MSCTKCAMRCRTWLSLANCWTKPSTPPNNPWQLLKIVYTPEKDVKESTRLVPQQDLDNAWNLQFQDLFKQKNELFSQVADGVESALTKEVQTIRTCQEKMRGLMEKSRAQMQMNRAAKCAAEADARDKHHAQGLDDRVHQMNMCSNYLSLYPGVDYQVCQAVHSFVSSALT